MNRFTMAGQAGTLAGVAIALAVLSGAILAVGLRRWRRRERRLFPHGRHSPGRFVRIDGLQSADGIPVSPHAWKFPPVPEHCSALVVVSGESSALFPEVRLTTRGSSTKHALPWGWRGHCTLDATPLATREPGQTIHLETRGLRLSEPPRLLTCGERPQPDDSILLCAPHPDDAELAAFGLYCNHVNRTWVVTFTAGERGIGWQAGEPAPAAYDRALRRVRESVELPVAGGVPRSRCQNLLLPDGVLSALLADPARPFSFSYDRVRLAATMGETVPATATGEAWLNRLRDLLTSVRPQIVVCPDPDCDIHPDHRATAQALALILREPAGASVRALYLYTIHPDFCETSPFGPAGAPWDPPPLTSDVPLKAFFSQTLDETAIAKKRATLLESSDVDALFRSATAVRRRGSLRDRLSGDSISLLRRCVRSSESFRVQSCADFIATTCPPGGRADPVSPPTVSVLIPCYNAERWLKAAIDSALAAAGVSEVIVVDDGSTDGSAAVARSFGDRIRFITQSNRGGNAARNELLRAARSEWVQYLDADDYLEPGKIATQLAEGATAPGAHVLYSPVWNETWRDGRAVERIASRIDLRSDVWTQWITWQLPQTGAALWRRSALVDLGGWNLRMPCCQEHELYLRALQRGFKFHYCSSPGAVYRVWSEQTVSRQDPVLTLRERIRLTDDMLAWLGQQGRLRPEHRRAAGQMFFEMARQWARYDFAAARRHYATRRGQGLILARGPAAPLSYQIALALLGFSGAEHLAHRLRTTP